MNQPGAAPLAAALTALPGAVSSPVHSTAAPSTVQCIALRDGAQSGQAFFAVVTQGELDDALRSPEVWLGGTELAFWKTLRVENKRQSALQGRMAAKRALGAALGEADVRKIEIARGTFGQPLVRHTRAGSSEAHFDVTVSHSSGCAVALAFPDGLPMGIDLETVAPASAQTVLGELQTSDAERAWLAQTPIDQADACAMLWSAREALGKSMKTGLNCPLGILALGGITPSEFGADGAAAWGGQYVNFPHSTCWLQLIGGRALVLALPASVTLASLPRMEASGR